MDMINHQNPVEILGLSRSFSQTGDTRNRVLHNLSLSIAEHEIVALVGRSGCGKTTLLHCLAGLVSPESGTILPPDLATHSAVVFQDHRLLPWATLEQNLLLALQANRNMAKAEKIRRVARMIAALDLTPFAKSKPAALSGGMAQRAALGRALLQEPRLLLMDEPFASLDALTRMDMHDLLLSLHDNNPCTILFVTHDLEEAVKLADRVVVMEQGGIVEDCPIRLAKPRDPDDADIRTIQRHLRQLVTKRSEPTHQ